MFAQMAITILKRLPLWTWPEVAVRLLLQGAVKVAPPSPSSIPCVHGWEALRPRQHSMPFVTYPTTQGMPWPAGDPGSSTCLLAEVPSQPTNLSIPTSTGCLDLERLGGSSRRPTLLGGAAAGLQKATAPPKPQARRTDPRPDSLHLNAASADPPQPRAKRPAPRPSTSTCPRCVRDQRAFQARDCCQEL